MRASARLASFLLLGAMVLQTQPRAEDVVQQELTTQRERLEDLRQEIAARQKKARQVEAGERSVLREIQEKDDEIDRQWERLQETRRAWTAKEIDLVRTQEEYREQEEAMGGLKKRVELRLRTIREMGTLGTLNVLFAAETLPELLARETYLRLILDRDREQRDQYRDRLRDLALTEARLEEERLALRKAADEIERQGLRLEEQKQAKRAFLDELRQQGEKYQEVIAELQRAESSLHAVIVKLTAEGRRADAERLKREDQGAFPSQKGRLPPPLAGRILRPPPQKDPGGRTVTSPGVLFEAGWGTEVRAVFDGKVVYSDNLPGYGNVLIIDHGSQYYTLVAQGARFFKSKGDPVAEGEIIGLAGGGPWIPEGIYFEIRHGDAHEDPLRWLDLRGLRTGP